MIEKKEKNWLVMFTSADQYWLTEKCYESLLKVFKNIDMKILIFLMHLLKILDHFQVIQKIEPQRSRGTLVFWLLFECVSSFNLQGPGPFAKRKDPPFISAPSNVKGRNILWTYKYFVKESKRFGHNCLN